VHFADLREGTKAYAVRVYDGNRIDPMKIALGFIICLHGAVYAQWTPVSAVPGGSAVYCIVASNDTVLAGTDSGFYVGTGGGTIWSPGPSPVPPPDAVCALVTVHGSIVAGTLAGGAFRSTDGGASWLAFSDGLTALGATHFGSIHVRRDSLLAGTLGAGVYVTSTDFTHAWTPLGDSLSAYEGDNVFSMIVVGATALAGAGGNGVIFRFTDSQPWWNPVPLRVPPIIGQSESDMATDGAIVLAATNFGVFRSTDQGLSWSVTDLGASPQTIQTLLHFHDRSVIAVETTPFNSTLYVSADTGRTWTSHGVFGIPEALSLAISGNTLFLGAAAGLWQAPLAGVLSSASVQQPAGRSASLMQSFPNPCNPSAWITYEVPEAGPVSLSVYDLLGRRVSTLEAGRVEAGTHQAQFDGSGLPSGVYFYRLESRGRTLTRSLLLLK